MDAFDIVFTETMIMMDLAHIRELKNLFDRNFEPGKPLSLTLIDLGRGNFAGTTSYFVNPRSIGRVADALTRGLAARPIQAIDHYFAREAQAGRLKVGVLFPFLSSVRVDIGSTIRSASARTAAQLLLRNSFFVEADIRSSRKTIAEIMGKINPPRQDARLDLIARHPARSCFGPLWKR